MRALRWIVAAAFAWISLAVALSAQEDDKGFLTRTLQDALSGAGRTVSIDGFEGALSAQASFDQMTIADDDGIWLTLREVQLDWNRSALLRGRLEVTSLTAASLDLPRLPAGGDTGADLPAAEATPFSLPDLPVSVDIADFAVDRITLGAPVLGQAADLRVQAAARLDGAGLQLDLSADRIDSQRGRFAVKIGVARDQNLIDLLITLSEGAGGLVAQTLAIPDQPAVDLRIAGAGPVDDLVTDIALSTDGQPRLTGQVTLGTEPSRRNTVTPDRRVRADLGGDVTALLAPRFQPFFGPDVRLQLDALLESNGATAVDSFTLSADAIDLSGQVALSAEGWPRLIDITGRIEGPDGTPVLLPLTGPAKTVEAADLRVRFDAAQSDALDAAFVIDALEVPGLSIAQLDLGLDGTLDPRTGAQQAFDGDVRFDANGLAMVDPAVAEALGTQLRGRTTISYRSGAPVEISALDISGADFALAGSAVIRDSAARLLTTLDLMLTAQDLSRFSALAGREMDGQASLSVAGQITPLDGTFDVMLRGDTQDLKIGIPQADAVLAGQTAVSVQALRSASGTFLRDLSLRNPALELTGAAALRTENSDVQADFRLDDVGLVVPQYSGPVTVSATASQDAAGWRVDARTQGPYGAILTAQGLATGPAADIAFTASVPDVAPFTPQVAGAVEASGSLRQTPEGWQIAAKGTGPYQASAAIDGLLTPLDVTLRLSLPDVQPLAPQVSGPVTVSTQVRQTQTGLEIDGQATGPYQLRADVAGQITPAIDLRYDVALPDTQPLVPQLRGAARLQGTVAQTDRGFVIDTTAQGPYGLRAAVAGLATGPDMRLTFETSLPDVAPLVPGVSGRFTANGVTRQTPAGIAIDTALTGPYRTRATVGGVVTGPEAAVQYDIDMPNLAAVVPGLNGPLAVDGTARKQGESWRVDTAVQGPAGTRADVAGTINPSGQLALDVAGAAPLGLSGPFIAPRSLQGQAQFDLAINGPPALSSVTGTIRTANASLSAPNLRLALEGIAADIQLARNRATLDVRGRAVAGGQVRVQGGIGLTGSLPADIQIALQQLALVDPRLYATTVDGALRLAGPLAGGARISGALNIGETEISVPATGVTTIGDIPAIQHIGAPRPVMSTRRKAGLQPTAQSQAGPSGPGFGLDLQINAPNRIFVRGRGLDAELGGGLRLTGSTNRIISAGRLGLIRGRLDILGRRFDLREGAIQFQGDLVPFIRFVSASETRTGEVRVIVQGPADRPEVTFESTPEAPQDEVLAQLLFGRNINDISAFQALQLASAVATLAGRGGAGVIANLRDGFGLDDLDVTTTDSGETAVRAGKYISENVYSDVTASSDGTADVSLNIDITPNLKGKATLGSDGDTGIGIFFEKDY